MKSKFAKNSSLVLTMTLFLYGTSGLAFANLIGLQNPAPYEWQLTRLDLSNGNLSNIGSSLSSFGITQGGTTFNSTSQTYIVNTSDGIKVIDSNSGELLNTFNVNLSAIEYDFSGGLIGLQNPAPYEWQLTRLDLSTGNLSNIGSSLSSFGITQGGTTFNSTSQTYIVNTSDGIKVIDSNSGELLNTFNVNLSAIEYDFSGALIGLQNPAPYEWQLTRLDLSNGNLSNIGSSLSSFGITQGGTTFNSTSQTYIVNTSDGIKVIDSNSGELLNTFNVNLSAIEYVAIDEPEPSTLAIFALGLMSLATRRFKKQS